MSYKRQRVPKTRNQDRFSSEEEEYRFIVKDSEDKVRQNIELESISEEANSGLESVETVVYCQNNNTILPSEGESDSELGIANCGVRLNKEKQLSVTSLLMDSHNDSEIRAGRETERSVLSDQPGVPSTHNLETSEAVPITAFQSILSSFTKALTDLSGANAAQLGNMKNDRAVEQIALFKEGGDIESYLSFLETELLAGEIPRGLWKKILLRKVPQNVKVLLADLLELPATTYQDIKKRLLARVGVPQSQLGMKIFGTWITNSRGRRGRDSIIQLLLWIDSFCSTCKTLEEVKIIVCQAMYRQTLSHQDCMSFDLCQVKNRQTLLDAVDHVDTLVESRRQQRDNNSYWDNNAYHRRNGYYGGNGFGHSLSSGCFRCGKPGHRAADCRTYMGPRGGERPAYFSSQQQHQHIVCYTCGKPGHKTPDCPDRNDKGNGGNSSSDGTRESNSNRNSGNVHDNTPLGV